MTRDEVIEELSIKIQADTRNENECAELLKEASRVLLPMDQGNILYVDDEQIAHKGRIDLLVYADCIDTFGGYQRTVYVWELKAPQLPLFAIDTESRARPSKYLYDAENQLIQYHDSLANNSSFRRSRDIISEENVKFGGIIIGRHSNNIVHNAKINTEKAKNLSVHALEIRQKLFYTPHGIQIYTWDAIINRLKLIDPHSFVTTNGDSSTVIDSKFDITLPMFIVEGSVETN